MYFQAKEITHNWRRIDETSFLVMAELFYDLKQWKIVETDSFNSYPINPILDMLYITYVEASHWEKRKKFISPFTHHATV